MQGDDPPYLSVGTAVSAKYKGAFCEAKVNKVVRLVKCKVTYKMGLGTATVTDEFVKGPLRIGQPVLAKHPDRKEFVDATITKIQDCSQYTVVFDDGDITTLRRTALCLKSGRHFNESETLDQLPLTHPEHFGNPVVGGRRGRRCRQLKEDSSEGEAEEENEPDLDLYSGDIGRVVCIEMSDKKRSKDNWFPGLVVIPSAQPTVRINAKDEFLVRSFKDGRYYTVPKKEVGEFTREMGSKVESSVLTEAVEKVIRYLDHDELPAHWERSTLFNIQSITSESDENFSDSSDEETCEEKDHFVAQLIKFMDDSNTPLNKSPMISNKDVDLHRLFRIVEKLGGYNRVTNKNKWRSVTLRMKLPNNHTTYNQVKQVYKKCLLNYESFYRTLGVTMLNHSWSAKKSKGRSLIRDKNRTTPVNSPKPEKEDEQQQQQFVIEKKEEEKPPEEKSKVAKRFDFKPRQEEEKRKKDVVEISDTNSSDATDQSEAASSSSMVRPRRIKLKSNQEHKMKTTYNDSQLKVMVEKFEDVVKKQDKEEEKISSQQTRSKIQQLNKIKELPPEKKVIRETKTPVREAPVKTAKILKKPNEEEKKRGRKKIITDDKVSDSSASESSNVQTSVNIGDKLKVYYGPTHESKVTYEAKVIEIDKDSVGPIYLVHYTGWNTRYDEWIASHRIAENLSASTKAKKLKQQAATAPPAKTSAPVGKPAAKRGRGMSITGRSTVPETPRSTTPSIVPSTSTRTRSPATPATTRTYRSKRQAELNRRTRLTSAPTETLNNSESESESESEFENTTSRLDSKGEQSSGIKTYRRKLVRTPSDRIEKRKEKDSEDTEKEEEEKTKRVVKKIKKNLEEKSTESDDDSSSNPPKGRDFDLNQIRSELKGFVKSVKIPTPDLADKDTVSSDESTSNANDAKVIAEELYENEKPDDKTPTSEKTINSDDIYEFKEPEPFEFESRTKTVDDKTKKRLVPRILDDIDKSPKKKGGGGGGRSPLNKVDDSENEIKRFRRTPVKKSPPSVPSSSEEEKLTVEDPFDKLIESPSFHSGKEKSTPSGSRSNVTRVLNLDEPLSLFRELPETVGEESRDILDISDNDESQNEPLFTRSEQIFSESSFSKSPLEHVLLDDPKHKDSDDDDETIRASIKNVIEQSSLAEYDSGDELVITQPTLSYQAKKKDVDRKYVPELPEPKDPTTDLSELIKVEKPATATTSKHISPALQESDPALMEAACTPPEILIKPEIKDIPVKMGPKIADTILQKFNMLKTTKVETKPNEVKVVKKEEVEENVKPTVIVDIKSPDPDDEIASITKDSKPPLVDLKTELIIETKPKLPETKPIVIPETKFKPIDSKIKSPEPRPKSTEQKLKGNEIKSPKQSESPKNVSPEPKSTSPEKPETKPEPIKPKVQQDERSKTPENRTKLASPQHDIVITDPKKRPTRKAISREFIEDSDSDSSDSEKKLVIARSDNDSPVNTESESKTDVKEEETSKSEENEATADDTQPQEPAKETETTSDSKPSTSAVETETKVEIEADNADEKEDEADSHLHSLLLCEETIPGSPTPLQEEPETITKQPSKSVLETPFASAPGSSNNSSKLSLHGENKSPKERHQQQPPVALPPIENRNASSTVLDNTPPTTPESTLSNLSPRGDNEDLSPNTADNDSYKSTEAEGEYSNKPRRSSTNKITPYSEEDTLMNAEAASLGKRIRDESATPAPCKKRRQSCKGSDEIVVPAKRGRKPANRSRHNTNSDSDDMSENSMSSNLATGSNIDTRPARSPRPSKYNFFVELDPSWDSSQRIALLQQKLQELRKTYADVKSELAAIERRRKKIRRREREAKLAAKHQESIAT